MDKADTWKLPTFVIVFVTLFSNKFLSLRLSFILYYCFTLTMTMRQKSWRPKRREWKSHCTFSSAVDGARMNSTRGVER